MQTLYSTQVGLVLSDSSPWECKIDSCIPKYWAIPAIILSDEYTQTKNSSVCALWQFAFWKLLPGDSEVRCVYDIWTDFRFYSGIPNENTENKS